MATERKVQKKKAKPFTKQAHAPFPQQQSDGFTQHALQTTHTRSLKCVCGNVRESQGKGNTVHRVSPYEKLGVEFLSAGKRQGLHCRIDGLAEQFAQSSPLFRNKTTSGPGSAQPAPRAQPPAYIQARWDRRPPTSAAPKRTPGPDHGRAPRVLLSGDVAAWRAAGTSWDAALAGCSAMEHCQPERGAQSEHFLTQKAAGAA